MSIKNYTIILFATLKLTLLSQTDIVAQNDTSPKEYNTLYINSYNIDYSWSRRVTNGLAIEYAKWEQHNLYPEYMDSRRNTYTSDDIFWKYLSQKYKGQNFDIIIVSDNAALNMIIKHPNSPLINNKPIVFCGISNPEDYDLEGMNLYGVIETTILDASFEIVRKLIPDLKNIVVLTDQTTTGRVYQNQAQAYLSNNKSITTQFIDSINTNNLDDVIEEINHIPNNVVFYYGITKYADGSNANDINIAETIATNCKAPVFSSYIADVPDITGGRYAFGEEHGKTTALLALRLLAGKTPVKRVFDTSSSFAFNYDKLIQFGLDVDLIPEGSELINEPINIWQRYRVPIIWISILILILFFAVVVLIRYVAIEQKNRILVEKARDNALESDRLKGAFLANVSHELRTPLNAVSGFSELAMAEQTNDNLRSYLQIIRNNTDLLSHLVNDILDLSLIDANEIKLQVKTFNLETCFEKIHAAALALLSTNNKTHIELNKHTNPKFSQFKGDELRISQIIQNLVSNAIKFTTEGSVIFGYDHLNVFPDIAKVYPDYHDTIFLYVQDTGIGINPEQQKLIFQRFSRDDSQYQNLHGGFGLGLHIAKALTELMGGEIYMRSQQGEGSLFGLILKRDQ